MPIAGSAAPSDLNNLIDSSAYVPECSFSHTVAAVSAQRDLASLFGMGTGVTFRDLSTRKLGFARTTRTPGGTAQKQSVFSAVRRYSLPPLARIHDQLSGKS